MQCANYNNYLLYCRSLLFCEKMNSIKSSQKVQLRHTTPTSLLQTAQLKILEQRVSAQCLQVSICIWKIFLWIFYQTSFCLSSSISNFLFRWPFSLYHIASSLFIISIYVWFFWGLSRTQFTQGLVWN